MPPLILKTLVLCFLLYGVAGLTFYGEVGQLSGNKSINEMNLLESLRITETSFFRSEKWLPSLCPLHGSELQLLRMLILLLVTSLL